MAELMCCQSIKERANCAMSKQNYDYVPLLEDDCEKAKCSIEQNRRKGSAEDRDSALVARMKSFENNNRGL